MQFSEKAGPVPGRRIAVFFGLIFATAPLFSQGEEKSGHPPANTFSIVAIDPETGELGIAVQSKIVAVGAVCAWGSADSGVVATQAFANVRYGTLGQQLLKMGLAPEQVIGLMTEHDPLKDERQVALIDPRGRVAAFTGEKCIDWAGHKLGDGYSVQGNLLTGPEVIDAMAEAFETTEGLLAERLIAALRAGQEKGGDKRGKQSAALLIFREGWGYGRLNDRFRDIRVDDHEEPIEELARVYELHRKMFRRPDQPPPKPKPKPEPEPEPDSEE